MDAYFSKRDDVEAFAHRMEDRLKQKDEKWGGNSWKSGADINWLHRKWLLKQGKINEILNAYCHGAEINKDGLKNLMADLANYSMMLLDNIEEK